VEGQFKNLKKIGVDKVKLGSIGVVLIYTSTNRDHRRGLISKGNDFRLKSRSRQSTAPLSVTIGKEQ